MNNSLIMEIKIRQAKTPDFDRLEKILKENEMLSCLEIDGKEAMQRIYERTRKYFLVAENNALVIGMIRGCYDGSRAVIHQLSVDKKYQRRGIGKRLIYELASRFKQDGALSISVTSDTGSKTYYDSLGFNDLSINLMVSFNIDKIIKNTS